jgi:hypothetical protein
LTLAVLLPAVGGLATPVTVTVTSVATFGVDDVGVVKVTVVAEPDTLATGLV